MSPTPLSFLDSIPPTHEMLARNVTTAALYLALHHQEKAAKKLLRSMMVLCDRAGKASLESWMTELPTGHPESKKAAYAARPHTELLALFD